MNRFQTNCFNVNSMVIVIIELQLFNIQNKMISITH